MRKDWDLRAEEGATFVAPSRSEEEFRESGKSDTLKLLSGIDGRHFEALRALDTGYGLGRIDEHFAPLFQKTHGIDDR